VGDDDDGVCQRSNVPTQKMLGEISQQQEQERLHISHNSHNLRLQAPAWLMLQHRSVTDHVVVAAV